MYTGTILALEPQLIRLLPPRDGRRFEHVPQSLITDDVDGIAFLCPLCYERNGGPVGTHQVLCWRPRVPAGIEPGPGRWELTGTGLSDLTLVAGSSSVLLGGLGGCGANFFIRAGRVVPC